MRTMTYDEAISYIHGVSWTFCKPGLERISALCEALGNPQSSLKFVHVAGTNGKGSFCAMLDSVLRKAGYRVGLFTSPYIVDFGERIRVDGEAISEDELSAICERLKPITDAMDDKPTEFELICAIAFLHFKACGCDVVILEAGLGGRLDSTNVIRNPLLSVITGISLDHTAILGDTHDKIAKEKAGIIKDRAPVLYGGDDEGFEVILNTALSLGSTLFRTRICDIKVKSATLDGTVLDYLAYKNIEIKLLGLYQPRNCATVLLAVDILRAKGLKISDEALREGLLSARWQARFEIISRDPLIIFDGAHNPEGIESAARSIRHYFGNKKLVCVTGLLRDKDFVSEANTLRSCIDEAYTITPDSPRALPNTEYAEVLRAVGIDAYPCPSPASALAAAIESAIDRNTAVICLGSLYTYASIKKALNLFKTGDM